MRIAPNLKERNKVEYLVEKALPTGDSYDDYDSNDKQIIFKKIEANRIIVIILLKKGGKNNNGKSQ